MMKRSQVVKVSFCRLLVIEQENPNPRRQNHLDTKFEGMKYFTTIIIMKDITSYL